MIVYTAPQGSDAWLEARRGVITGSRFKDCRDRSDGLTEQQRSYVQAILTGIPQDQALLLSGYKKAPTSDAVYKAIEGTLPKEWGAKANIYSMDVARERVGGKAASKFTTYAMREGQEEEPRARQAYEARTGCLVDEAGFITTDDRLFGVSVDGFVDDDGIIEIKTMVSSDTLFTAVVDGDISEYIDQCNGAMWLLGRQWVDIVLWAPDMAGIGLDLTIRRITRDDDAINALEDDLMAFASHMKQYERKLLNLAAQEKQAWPLAA